MKQQVLLDTGPLVAILSKSDNWHGQCVEVLRRIRPPLLTTWPVITEAHWLLRKSPILCESLFVCLRSGLVELCELPAQAGGWIGAFLSRYRNVGAQVADASLVFLAEKCGSNMIFTLDRRDFSIYRFAGRRRFSILP